MKPRVCEAYGCRHMAHVRERISFNVWSYWCLEHGRVQISRWGWEDGPRERPLCVVTRVPRVPFAGARHAGRSPSR